MPHHFTKNTVEASAWCNPCNQRTQHRIDDGRIGPCLRCVAKLEVEHDKPKAAPEPKQENLF